MTEKTKMDIERIDLLDKSRCTGCMACGDICPKKAISFEFDDEGFWFPKVDEEKCINCKICASHCPSINLPQNNNVRDNIQCFGLWNKNEEIRRKSTSGGFFTTLATLLVNEGWHISGAVYDDKMQVKHIIADTCREIELLRQSKYVQSDITGIYKDIKNKLNNGEKAFFCGTPCQVAALYAYLNTDYKNLLTMDFICCGISSPVVYGQYLKWLEKKYRSKIKRIWFKDKRAGWSAIGTSVLFENGKEYFRTGEREPYMISFVTDGNNIRKSCYQCPYRNVPHRSDFTAGDFWGLNQLHPEFNDEKGTTALMINTEQGMKIFEKVRGDFHVFSCDVEDIAAGNFTVYSAKKPRKDRHDFLLCACQKGFSTACAKYSSYRGVRKLKIEWRNLKQKIKKKM